MRSEESRAPELGRHRLRGCEPDEPPQLLLEPVALAAVPAGGGAPRLDPLRLRQLGQVRLQQLLAIRTVASASRLLGQSRFSGYACRGGAGT